ncbi:hypothetical protein GCM10022415_11190 [Knoellia locipacati]|uniref:Uncharacterized protein n=1 Tax=Knoellia locipacati TaxID=882824 RepID=A0A512SYN7_9MICO|nr:hypothetical protein [Knoellia locipacati]GEQ13070.1 hypothetical protein KLO01_11170 [Knoellia locipacati]
MRRRFDFAFAPAYRLPAMLFGIRPETAWVDVGDDELRVRFGPWRLTTALENITGCEESGGFAWIKTAGPPHLSLTDRGVTFATNGDRALCVTFRDPVPGIDPTRTIKHPGATLTVVRPDLLRDVLTDLTGGSAAGTTSPTNG